MKRAELREIRAKLYKLLPPEEIRQFASFLDRLDREQASKHDAVKRHKARKVNP